MIPSNPIPQVCNYGSSASYCTCPSDEQIANGVVPLDSLPASWWNWLWSKTNTAVNCARYAAGVLIDEVNTVLTQAGVCVNPACVDQLYRAINNIRQTIGTADVAGAVKSSSTASEVAIDPTTGKMSVNCLGNAASLTTTATTVVGAINELKSTYDCCVSALNTAIGAKAAVGNSAGAALAYAASAGSAATAARSDHVHPIPQCIRTSSDSSEWYVFTRYNTCCDSRYLMDISSSCAGTSRYGIHVAYADSASYATRAGAVCTCAYSTAYDFDVKLTNQATSQNQYDWVSACCRLKYCNTTGALRITDANGNIKGSVSAACFLGCACCAGLVYLDQFTASADRPIVVACPRGTTGFSDQGVSTACSFTFNPATGEVKANTFTGCASDSAKLNGYGSSTSNTANCIVRRDANGYVYAAYYNQASAAEAMSSSSCLIFANSDGWFRKTTINCFMRATGFTGIVFCSDSCFKAADWYPYNMDIGCVYKSCCACNATMAGTACYAYCGHSLSGNTWDGRSNKSGTCWCACLCNSTCLQFCNCGYGILLYSVKNGSQCCAGIVPSYGKGNIVCCMLNGTSCAQAWYIYPW